MTRAAMLGIAAAAAAIFALTLGLRTATALFIGPINTQTGLGLVAISFAFGIGQLVWGAAQPFAGAIADRWGAGRVVAGGMVMVGAGAALIPFSTNVGVLTFAVGILMAAGAGAAGPSVLLAAMSRLLPVERRAMASAVVNAGGAIGQFTVVPLAQALLTWGGWMPALWWLSGFVIACLPLAWAVKGVHAPATGQVQHESMGVAVKRAFGDRNYLLLAAGFFTCGFHVAFISTHMPGVVAACQLPPEVGAWSLAVIGLFNLGGSLGIGWAMGRWRSRSLLSIVYAMRAVAILGFLAAPKTELTIVVFSAVLGLTWLSTVPPTAGLVAKFYGPRYMATLFGVLMFSHQIGGFLGAYLGGVAFTATGAFDWMWWADIALALFAAAVHLPIREKPIRPVAVPA
jgi:predicted MFS family arabinose efflux permease